MLSDLEKRVALAVKGQTILVTGAAGTIGSALTERLLQFDPKVVRLLDQDEERTFFLDLDWSKDQRVRTLLGDVRDRERMNRALHGVDIVIHTAALKHVGLGEYNPFEVVRTNLVALQGLIEASINANVGKFIFTSSDKAVNPTNVMGGSKFIGERLVTAGNVYRGGTRTIFASTRFGNVLGSAGSVIPVFQNQIRQGGPITVTDMNMTRFFMSLSEAVDLVLSAMVASLGGEVFVPKMKAIRLKDLAEGMREIIAPNRKIAIKEIGLRPGEKMFEELISDHELPRCLETEHLLIVLPYLECAMFSVPNHEGYTQLGPDDYPDKPRWAKNAYNSHHVDPITKKAALDMLRSSVLTKGN